jgi:hypothetical protein
LVEGLIMKPSRVISTLALVAFGSAGVFLAASSAATAPASAAGVNRYIGAKKCKSCHRSEAAGNQFGAWQEMKHAHAFETLASPAAIALAKDAGVANPQESAQCVRCHSTAFGLPKESIKKGFDVKQGVQCESCHGPGEKHFRARFAAAAKQEGTGYTAVPADEIVARPPMSTCLGCHNEDSPSFKSFCYYERVGSIRHLDPRKPRGADEAMAVCGCDSCACVHGCDENACPVPP